MLVWFKRFVLFRLVAATAVLACAEFCIVTDCDGSEPVSFELDIQPILTKAGCNSGPCHGKQGGQNGFQLSLLGFDSDYDYHAILSDARGRRLFPAAPDSSLLLEKAVGIQPHGGGKRFELDSEEWQKLLSWIEQGAPRSITGEPTLESIELQQATFVVPPRESRDLVVVARYSDGATRDVTSMTDFLSNEEAVVSVDEEGQFTAGKLPGETAIMARYRNHIAVADVVIPNDSQVTAEYFAQLPKYNFIDELVYQKLLRAGLKPSAPADEHVFLRRAYLDIIGRLPTVQETRNFLDTQSESKREYLIDELLDRPEYISHRATYWADLLRPNPYRVGIKAVLNYDNWIRQQFREEVTYDEFAKRLITAKGSTWQNGAVTLFRDRRSPDEMATLVSQLFLGVRLDCAKCHHHPFEKWSQRDFYQFAAFFAKVGHKGTGLSPPISGGEETIFTKTSGTVSHPKSGEALDPRPLFGDVAVDDERDAREALVAWMLADGSDYFAKVQVNRVWSQMMGRGLVEPVDDLRSTNPPTNPELLQALADHFRETGYDTRALIKTIASSYVYSLSSLPNETNAGDRLNYSRHYRHRLRAEVLMDAVTDITETELKLSGVPAGSRSNQIWTHRVGSTFLDTFGRPDPNQDPPCERTSDSTVTQALHLMNSEQLHSRIRNAGGRAARLAESDFSDDELLNELYLAVYSRYPNEAELQFGRGALRDGQSDRRATVEDLLWALMNTPECFIQN